MPDYQLHSARLIISEKLVSYEKHPAGIDLLFLSLFSKMQNNITTALFSTTLVLWSIPNYICFRSKMSKVTANEQVNRDTKVRFINLDVVKSPRLDVV